MSTISSYFGRTRKSTQNNELNHSAVRAPEPVNEPVKKTLIKQKQKKANKTSILYYLTPQTTTTPEETEVNEEVKIVEEKSNRDDDLDEDEHVVCKIRHMKPFSSIWETILDEYDDPSAHMYPLPDARFIKKELYIKNMEIPDPLQNKRRFNECEELPESSDDETVKVSKYTYAFIKLTLFP